MNEELLNALVELRPEFEGMVEDRAAFSARHYQAFHERFSLTEEFNQNLWRLRNYAAEVAQSWKPGREDLDGYLELMVVDAHDAAIDALASLASGMGAPAVALIRRLYELGTILVAGWEDPVGLLNEMEKANKRQRQDDHYAAMAQKGVLGAAMPTTAHVRALSFTDDGVESFERGLNSIGHGGILAAAFYVGSDRADDLRGIDTRLGHSLELAPFVTQFIQVTAAASWQILRAIGIPSRVHRGKSAV